MISRVYNRPRYTPGQLSLGGKGSLNYEVNFYEEFLQKLRPIKFLRITRVLARRESLKSFLSKETGCLVRREEPDFGEQIKRWGDWETLKKLARPYFDYYCGFAGEVHFTKKSRSNRPIWPLPVRGHFDYLPQVDDLIMGQTEAGATSLIFSWWDTACLQDQRFQQIITGNITFSSKEKYEAKLTVEIDGCPDKTLFWALQALHFRDLDFFVRIWQAGQTTEHQSSPDIAWWLEKFIFPILPDFWEKFKQRTGLK